MIKAVRFPGKYIQGYNALYSLENEIINISKEKPFILCGPFVSKYVLDKTFIDNLRKIGTVKEFGGECTDEEIDKCVSIASKNKCDSIIGIGGGKVLDTAKAVSDILDIAVITIPTSLTNAAGSALSVIYTNDGKFKEYKFLKNNPNIVIVDSKIITHLSIRLFAAGIGDALATCFEAESCKIKHVKNMANGYITDTAFNVAKFCYDLLIEYGFQAKLACEEEIVTPALEHVIEAVILLSNIGFENSGIAAAHAIHDGLTMLPETHDYFHGEKVAFGLLASLFLTDKPVNIIDSLYDYYIKMDLPISFRDIGLNGVDNERLLEAIDYIFAEGSSIYNEPVSFDKIDVLNALKMANTYGIHKLGYIDE